MQARAAETLVRDFCAAWHRRDLDAIVAAMDVDIVYWNLPAPPVLGREAVRAFLVPLIRDTIAIEFELHAVAGSEAGDKVLTERLDRLTFPSGVLEIPVMGIFELRHGLITAWREYADFASIGEAVARLGVSLSPAPA